MLFYIVTGILYRHDFCSIKYFIIIKQSCIIIKFVGTYIIYILCILYYNVETFDFVVSFQTNSSIFVTSALNPNYFVDYSQSLSS